MNHLSISKRFLLVGCALGAVACPSLPKNFERLSLPEKIAAYEAHFRNHGLAQGRAEAAISWYGWEAAELMAPYASGKRATLPKTSAIQVIWLVQQRGCSLAGTSAERALEEVLTIEKPESHEAFLARLALDSIRSDRFFPDGPDSLKGSPCEGHPPRPPQYDLRVP